MDPQVARAESPARRGGDRPGAAPVRTGQPRRRRADDAGRDRPAVRSDPAPPGCGRRDSSSAARTPRGRRSSGAAREKTILNREKETEMSMLSMSAEENIEVVRKIFRAIEERDAARLLELFDPEVEFHWPPSLPYAANVYGRPGEGLTWAETWLPLQTSEVERRMAPRHSAARRDARS